MVKISAWLNHKNLSYEFLKLKFYMEMQNAYPKKIHHGQTNYLKHSKFTQFLAVLFS